MGNGYNLGTGTVTGVTGPAPAGKITAVTNPRRGA